MNIMIEFKRIELCSNTLFHYTTLENAKRIIEEGKIRTGNDVFCFFTESEEKSRELFFKLMEQGTEYIDDDLTVQKRQYCNPQENVILKIAIKNDNQFYRFICEADGFNPYEYSLLHLGELEFENVEILPIVQKETEQIVSCIDSKEKVLYKKNHYKNVLKKTVATSAIATILTMNTFPIFATSYESWLDLGKYDISWYSESKTEFDISTASQLAGISYLVHNNKTLDNKTFNIMNDIDLTAYQWVTIPKEFNGVIEGLHKVLIKTYQTPFVEEASDKGQVTVSYAIPVSGIEDGKSDCGAVDVIGSYDSIDNVKINDVEVNVTDGKFTVLPASKKQVVVVTDEAGHEVSYSITVNEGHTWGQVTYEWTADNNICSATRYCTIHGCDGKQTETVATTFALTQKQTCILPELTTYTANFTNAAFAMQIKENVQTAKATGHRFSNALDSTCNDCGFSRNVIYPFIKGGKQTITKGNAATLTVNAPFPKFLKVQMDGRDVANTNYTAVSGSTKVTLKEDYINSLTEGVHTLTIVFKDGKTSTTFTLNDTTESKNENNPKTGDSSNMVLWGTLQLISMMAIVALLTKKKRQI